MKPTYIHCLRSGELLSLTDELGSGGEGTVYKTSKPNYVAKIYSSEGNQEKLEKLRVMLDNPPSNPSNPSSPSSPSSLSKEHISIAWPVDILLNQCQNPVGFLMPEIRSSKPLISVYSSAKREKEAVGFNWRYLHTTALNIALILKSLHRSHYTVGDLKPDNFRVNDRSLVSIIDTDSFQVKDLSTGKIYYSSMGSDEYTPPEMYGQDFSSVERSAVQDLFGLAIVIWLLIFGKHPFSGKWQGSGNDPLINDNIRDGYWVYGDQSKIQLADSAIPINVVHPELQKLFYQCFSVGHNNPYARPTASEWCEALKISINDLQNCQFNREHYYSTVYKKCYWCEINDQLKYDIFPDTNLAASSKNNAKVTIAPISAASVSPRTASRSSAPTQTSRPTPTRSNPVASGSFTFSSLNRTTTSSSQRISSPVSTNSNVSSPSHSPKINSSTFGYSCLALVLLFIVIAFGKCTSQSNQQSKTRTAQNYPNWNFPRSECGDSNPPGLQNFYPVFVNHTDDATLRYIKNSYCRDAYLMTRISVNRKAIQVASFKSKDKAFEFLQIMQSDSRINSAEVGSPSQR
jgi:hypothetical protein